MRLSLAQWTVLRRLLNRAPAEVVRLKRDEEIAGLALVRMGLAERHNLRNGFLYLRLTEQGRAVAALLEAS